MVPVDIWNVVLSYVEPENLIGFMIQHGLGKCQLKYDGYDYSQGFWFINEALIYNPNLVVIGICIMDITEDADLCGLNFPLYNLKRIRLIGSTYRSPRYTITSLNALKECVSCVRLKIEYLIVTDLGAIIVWKKLRAITLGMERIETKCLRILSQCHNLRVLELKGRIMNDDDLSLDNINLRRFRITMYGIRVNAIERFMLGKCLNLRCVKIVCHHSYAFVPIVVLQQIRKLRHIELVNCVFLGDVGGLVEVKGLKRLSIIDCDGMKDASVLKKCKRLRYLNTGVSSDLGYESS